MISGENEQLNGEIERLRNEIDRLKEEHQTAANEIQTLKVQLDERTLLTSDHPTTAPVRISPLPTGYCMFLDAFVLVVAMLFLCSD